MEQLIAVFRMSEIKATTRARIIIALGRGINMQLGGNYTEEIVFELVSILDPSNAILTEKTYSKFAKSGD